MLPPARQLVLAQRHLTGATIVTAGGELDATTSDRFGRFVLRSRHPGDHLVLDLGDLSFMDSSGLHQLLTAHRDTRRDGATLRLAALQRTPARIIKITGVGAYLPVHPTLEQAVSVVLSATRTRRRATSDGGAAPM